MSKTKSRETAMKMLFASSLGGDYSADVFDDPIDVSSMNEKDSSFCQTIVEGVKAHTKEIQDAISEYAQGWSIDRIGKVELCILEIAVFEILFLPEVPVGASVNEAVELAKTYCDDKSPAFINGILGSIGRKYRS